MLQRKFVSFDFSFYMTYEALEIQNGLASIRNFGILSFKIRTW